MLLVYETVGKDGHLNGSWDIAWMWVPQFITLNPGIAKFVSERMTSKFVGQEMKNGLAEEMHQEVIDLLCERFPIRGLREYLSKIADVHPEEDL